MTKKQNFQSDYSVDKSNAKEYYIKKETLCAYSRSIVNSKYENSRTSLNQIHSNLKSEVHKKTK
jgi:hypothetical protein